MPPGFDPNMCFGDENEDSDDVEELDGNHHSEQQNTEAVDDCENETITNRKMGARKQSISKLSWDEKQKLLHKIYDEEEIPPQLLTVGSLRGEVGNK